MYTDESVDNIKNLFNNPGLLDFLLRFEEYLDNSNIYLYDNIEDGVVCAGPIVSRYDIEITLKYDTEKPPNPRAFLLLQRHGTIIQVKSEIEEVPRTKIQHSEDLRTDHLNKPKMDSKKITLVKFIVPRRILDDKCSTEYDILQQSNMEDITTGGMQAPLPSGESPIDDPMSADAPPIEGV